MLKCKIRKEEIFMVKLEAVKNSFIELEESDNSNTHYKDSADLTKNKSFICSYY